MIYDDFRRLSVSSSQRRWRSSGRWRRSVTDFGGSLLKEIFFCSPQESSQSLRARVVRVYNNYCVNITSTVPDGGSVRNAPRAEPSRRSCDSQKPPSTRVIFKVFPTYITIVNLKILKVLYIVLFFFDVPISRILRVFYSD